MNEHSKTDPSIQLKYLPLICHTAYTAYEKPFHFVITGQPKFNFMKTLKVILLLVFSAALLTNCDTKEKQQLQSKVDSLQVELQTAQQMASTLQEVGQLMDEIDATRNVLRATTTRRG